MPSSQRVNDLMRIRRSLEAVSKMISSRSGNRVSVSYSSEGDPVTSLDRDINISIFGNLPLKNEGWLSEESKDDPERLKLSRVWVVDPIDGTREFVEGIPEWCVSIALVEDHEAVAGGILNPSTGEMFLGSKETGLEVIGPDRSTKDGEARKQPRVLVSRREHGQGKWDSFGSGELEVMPIGSIAYRLAQVAAGYAEATCTFDPRSEWDVAGGVALVQAAGGNVQSLDGTPVKFNKPVPRLNNFFAFGKGCPATLSDRFGAKGLQSPR